MVYNLHDPLAHAVEVPHDLVVGESKDMDAVVCEERIALGITFTRLRIGIMRLAIKFDGESHGRRVEIDDHTANRVLSPKLHAELLVPETLPEHKFRSGHVRSKVYASGFEHGCVSLETHTEIATPSRSPSTAAWRGRKSSPIESV